MSFTDKIKALFKKNILDDEILDDLTDILIEGDLGAKFAYQIVEDLKAVCKKEKITQPDLARRKVKELLSPYARTMPVEFDNNSLNIILLLGVNGVGKTTSCAKLAQWSRNKGIDTVVLSAGDTFRAAAVNQLKIHGERLGIRVVAHAQGADGGAVLWDAIDATKQTPGSLVIGDTAGRMHTRQDLLRELEKLDKIVVQRAPHAQYKKYLVLDSTTGQNGLRQAETFGSAVKLDGVILTKYDSSAKGGMVLSLAKELNLPTLFLGTGEGYKDFIQFSPHQFLDELLGI